MRRGRRPRILSAIKIALKGGILTGFPCHCGSVPTKPHAIVALENADLPKCIRCGKILRVKAFMEHNRGDWEVVENPLVIEDALKVVFENSHGGCTEENWAHRKCLKKLFPRMELPRAFTFTP